jgi:hypothetical protein
MESVQEFSCYRLYHNRCDLPANFKPPQVNFKKHPEIFAAMCKYGAIFFNFHFLSSSIRATTTATLPFISCHFFYTQMGDVVGPSSSTANSIARFDGTTGKLLKNGTTLLSDAGDLTNVLTINCGTVTNNAVANQCVIFASETTSSISANCKASSLLGTQQISMSSTNTNVLRRNSAIASSTGVVGTTGTGLFQDNVMVASHDSALNGAGSGRFMFNFVTGTSNQINSSGTGETMGCVAMGGSNSIGTTINANSTRCFAIGLSNSIPEGTNVFLLGKNNTTSGARSNCIAIGAYLTCNVDGCLLLGDANTTVLTAGTNALSARFSGGYYFFSNSTATVGVTLVSGGTAWAALSDPKYKTAMKPVSYADVYEKFKQLPVFTYMYLPELDPERIKRLGTDAVKFNNLFGNDQLFPASMDKDGRMLLDSGNLSYITMATLKEGQSKIAELETLIATLEEEVNSLFRLKKTPS